MKRSLSDPVSLIGATPQEIQALKPEGWLVRPMPGRDGRFRMISPGRMPGAHGTFSVQSRNAFRYFAARPEPWLFVLNCATEQPLLVEILTEWAPGGDPAAGAPDIPLLAGAAGRLVRDHLISAYRDPLAGELVRLDDDQASRAVADPLQWWRDEDAEPAASVIGVAITEAGERALAAA